MRSQKGQRGRLRIGGKRTGESAQWLFATVMNANDVFASGGSESRRRIDNNTGHKLGGKKQSKRSRARRTGELNRIQAGRERPAAHLKLKEQTTKGG